MNPSNSVDNLITDIKERLTLDGKNKVFEEGMELCSEFMKEKAEPEAFIKEFLIDKILDALGLEKLPEKSFETPSGYRSVDYRIKSKGRMFLVEAKPLNADLFEKSKSGGINQIKGLFKLVEVKENYDFGVATDGLRWIFIDKSGKIVNDLRLKENFEKIKEFLAGKERVVSPETEEEISKKFYDWYNALLHGGRYKDGKGGMFSYIISNSFNTSKFADKSKKFILENYCLKQIDFFKNIKVFKGVGIENVILIVRKSEEKENTRRILHTDSFDNIEELEPSSDVNKIFRISAEIDFGSAFENTELLGNICFISYGLRPNSDERYWKGEFKKDDLISDTPTRINKKPYVEAKYIGRYKINKIKYLEWDTERSPKKLARPTFPELYIHPKIIRGATVDGTYDESGLVCNHSINVMVRYGSLKSVSNRSIENSIKKWSDKTRKKLEKIKPKKRS